LFFQSEANANSRMKNSKTEESTTVHDKLIGGAAKYI